MYTTTRFQQMSSGALAVVGTVRLPARSECVGLKGLCVCVAPRCRQAAGPHTHTPYSYATSLKIARLWHARAAHGVRKWVIRVGNIYTYYIQYTHTFFFTLLSFFIFHFPFFLLARSP